MADYQLIVSNPPHTAPDPTAVAPHLGLSAAEVRMQLNFPAPEIWIAEAEKDAAAKTATALLGAGANVAWIPGSVLAAAPQADIGLAIAIEGNTVVVTTVAGDLTVNTGDRVVAVVGEPVQREGSPVTEIRPSLPQNEPGRGSGQTVPFASGITTGVGGAAGSNAINKVDNQATDARDSAEKRLSGMQFVEPTELFLDVYALGASGWKAARLSPSHTDFSGLGERKQAMARANMGVVLEALRAEFGARVDERLIKVTYKPTIVSGQALNQVLSSISEHLGALPLLDIGSKLAFLTSKD